MSQNLAFEPYQGLDNEPIYNMKAVVEATGITAATLRAWERRYGAFSPGRTDSGYRLYSARDIAILRWLKARVDEGMSISQAISLLTHRKPLAAPVPAEDHGSETRGPRGAREALLSALLRYDESVADRVLEEAFAVYGLEGATERILTPAMAQIGDMWHDGRASTTAEHFASNYLRRKMEAIINAAPQANTGPLVVLGCGPGDWHELGLLLIHMMLRRRNVNAIYLGQNVPVAEFVEEMERLKPAVIVMGATTAETVPGLIEIAGAVQAMSPPRPMFAFGGRIFNVHPELRPRVAGIFLGEDGRAAVHNILALISGMPQGEPGSILHIRRDGEEGPARIA